MSTYLSIMLQVTIHGTNPVHELGSLSSSVTRIIHTQMRVVQTLLTPYVRRSESSPDKPACLIFSFHSLGCLDKSTSLLPSQWRVKSQASVQLPFCFAWQHEFSGIRSERAEYACTQWSRRGLSYAGDADCVVHRVSETQKQTGEQASRQAKEAGSRVGTEKFLSE